MGIAKYFSKDLLAINQLLKSNNKTLEQVLFLHPVGIGFDQNAVEKSEGRMTLDLIVRLVARLYPKISIIDFSGKNSTVVAELKTLAKQINGNIELVENNEELKVLIVTGQTQNAPTTKAKCFFVGSNNWNAKFSLTVNQGFRNSDNPFGCGVAACLTAANVFKHVFREYFDNKPLDQDVNFSVLTYGFNEGDGPSLTEVKLEDVSLIGVGAIGNGFVWALKNIQNLTGSISIVDPEDISVSNLQRYVLFDEGDINKSKVQTVKKFLTSEKLKVEFYKNTWAEYLGRRGNWDLKTIAVAIDNKKDRIAIQSSLPRTIFNAYTEENLIGIARHQDFLTSPCLACGYIPAQKERNYTEEVAANCNIPAYSNFVKDYLNLNVSVDSTFNNNTVSLLDVIATSNGINRELLNQFSGKRVNQFYSEFVCGGISLSLTNASNIATNVDAPLAFQSAMAGILLAAEIALEKGNNRGSSLKQQSHFYPLNPLTPNNPYNHNLSKDSSGKCLCADQTFIDQYKIKWKEKDHG